MVVKRVQGSKKARVEKANEINRFQINVLKVVIDVLMETGNEFLQPKMPSSRSFFVEHKVFWYQTV